MSDGTSNNNGFGRLKKIRKLFRRVESGRLNTADTSKSRIINQVTRTDEHHNQSEMEWSDFFSHISGLNKRFPGSVEPFFTDSARTDRGFTCLTVRTNDENNYSDDQQIENQDSEFSEEYSVDNSSHWSSDTTFLTEESDYYSIYSGSVINLYFTGEEPVY